MKVLASLRMRFHNCSFIKKIYIVFLCAVILPLLIIMVFSSLDERSIVIEETASSYQKMFDQISDSVNEKNRTIRSLLNIICGDSNIQNWDLANADEKNVLGNFLIYTNTYRQSVFNGHFNAIVSRIQVYMDNDDVPFEDTLLFDAFDEASKQTYLDWAAQTGTAPLWITHPTSLYLSTPSYIYCFMRIPSAYKFNDTLGIMRADIPSDTFHHILGKGTITNGTFLCLADSDGNAFVYSGNEVLTEQPFIQTVLSKTADSDQPEQLKEIHTNKGSFLVGSKTVDYSDWNLIFAVPMSDITFYLNKLTFVFLAGLAAVLLFSLPIFYLATRSLTSPLRSLSSQMSIAAQGDFEIRIKPTGHDEVDQLIEAYNSMLRKIDELMKNVYSMGWQLKEREAQVFQEQINPHFLYNTLDLIGWMAHRHEADDIKNVVDNLSRFYQLTLNQGELTTEIARELEHVETYVYIQNLRFGGRISLEIDVPEHLKNHSIIKLTLQPLVENAIHHGIRESESGEGRIRITGSTQGEDILLTIEDDGVGMSDEMLLQANDHQAVSGGFGIGNINARQNLFYGARYTLFFERVQPTGTRVTVRIPITPSLYCAISAKQEGDTL